MILISTLLCLTAVGYGQDWLTDFDTAKKVSAEEHKPIILAFKGSDWCAPCIKLDHEIFGTEEFKSYASDHFVLLEADFPRKKQNKLSDEQQAHNNALAAKYNTNGYFPFVVVLDENGKVLNSTGYQHVSPAEFISILESN